MAEKWNPNTARMEQATETSDAATIANSGIPKDALAAKEIPMIAPDGVAVLVPKDRLGDVLKSGYQYESPEAAQARRDRADYDAPVTAGLLGAARGVTFGTSDLAARVFGKANEVRKYKENNPAASTIGEIGGVGALALASGGTSLAGEGAAAAGETAVSRGLGSALLESNPVALASRAGEGVTKSLAEKIVGDAGASRVLGKAASAAAGGATEGALYGAGQGVSDVALQQEPIDPSEAAEHIVAATGFGALVGGGIGAGVSLAGEGVSAGSKKLKDFVGGSAKPVDGSALDGLNARQMDYAAEQRALEKPNAAAIRNAAYEEGVPLTQAQTSDSPFIQNTHSSLEQSSTFLGAPVRAEVAATREGMQQSAKNVLSDASQTETADSIGQKLRSKVESKIRTEHTALSEGYQVHEPDFQKMIIDPKDVQRTADAILDHESIGLRPNSAPTRIARQWSEDLGNAKNVSQLRRLTTDLGEDIRAADRAGDGNLVEMLRHVKDQAGKLRDVTIKRAEDSGLLEKGAVSSIRGLDKKYAQLNGKAAEIAEELGLRKVKSLRGFYNALEDTSNEALARKMFNTKEAAAMRYMKAEFPEEYEALRRYKMGEILAASTKDGRIHIPTLLSKAKAYSPEAAQEIFGFQGARSIKNLKTLSEAFPKMVGPSGTPQGLDYANLLSPSYWTRYASDAYKLAVLRGASVIEKTAQKQNKTIEGAFTKFFSKTAEKVAKPLELGVLKGGSRALMPQIEALANMSSNPQKLTEDIAHNTKGLENHDTETHAALTNTLVEAVTFLQSKAPKNPGRDDVFGKSKWHPSDTEMAKFNRYVRAVDNPLSILEDFNKRVLTFEGVEAVKTIYPQLYKKLSSQAIERASKAKNITFQDKIQLSILLQMPVNSAGDPQFIKRLQNNMAPVSDSMQDTAGPKLNQGGLKQLDRSSASETQTERLLKR